MDYLLKVAKRKCVVFLISDFLDDNYFASLKIVNKKHDLVAIQIIDPAELEFPDLGLLKVEDPETNELFWVDTGSSKIMNQLKKNCQKTSNLPKRNEKSWDRFSLYFN